jgi:catechol 2,3-dioxygenase-like lactoylglutathione lyase family enzyme
VAAQHAAPARHAEAIAGRRAAARDRDAAVGAQRTPNRRRAGGAPGRRHLILLAVVLCASSLRGADAQFAVHGVDSIGITVADLDKSVEFYTHVLGFERQSEDETHGVEIEHLHGVFGARRRTARLRLGEEFLELTEYLAPQGRPFPADTRSNDRWFQHIALITGDMDKAYRHLRSHKVRHASPGPQRLPDWNPNAGGIEAFYFRDPDGHHLEVLAFPAGKGAEKWHRKAGGLFLGIDHTAIVIEDTEASLRFYRGVLGMRIAGESENYGPEQERLNNVFGARLRITSLRADRGPGVELLEYLAPGGGRPYPPDAKANDLVHWTTRFSAASVEHLAQRLRNSRAPFISTGVVTLPVGEEGARRSVLVRDPDGHAVQILENLNN